MAESIVCVLEHPTQFDPPVWDGLRERGHLSPHVWYARRSVPTDKEITRTVTWRESDGLGTIVADRDIPRRLAMLPQRPAAVLTPGWTRRRTWVAWAAARRLGVPVILPTDKTLNDPSPRMPARGAIALFHTQRVRCFQGFLTTGILGTQYLGSLGVPHWRVATGLYAVDGQWWRARVEALAEESRALRARLGPGLAVLAVAKLTEREGVLDLTEGFARFCSDRQPASLVLVGDGPLRAQVEARVEALGIRQRVTMAGYAPYTQLAAYYGAADVFAHVPNREPWGISVGEAMSCGLPVIASTTVGSSADLVVAGRTGALVPPGDPGEIGAALRAVAAMREDPGLRERLLARAAKLEAKAAAEELEHLVGRLAERRPPDFAPIEAVMIGELRNIWGKWSA